MAVPEPKFQLAAPVAAGGQAAQVVVRVQVRVPVHEELDVLAVVGADGAADVAEQAQVILARALSAGVLDPRAVADEEFEGGHSWCGVPASGVG